MVVLLNALLSLSREQTGLSESQQEILSLFAQGLSDAVIAQRLGISNSTVRNHRFKLKEKERQAKVFLSIMAHLEEQDFVLPIQEQPCWMIVMQSPAKKKNHCDLLRSRWGDSSIPK